MTSDCLLIQARSLVLSGTGLRITARHLCTLCITAPRTVSSSESLSVMAAKMERSIFSCGVSLPFSFAPFEFSLVASGRALPNAIASLCARDGLGARREVRARRERERRGDTGACLPDLELADILSLSCQMVERTRFKKMSDGTKTRRNLKSYDSGIRSSWLAERSRKCARR